MASTLVLLCFSAQTALKINNNKMYVHSERQLCDYYIWKYFYIFDGRQYT